MADRALALVDRSALTAAVINAAQTMARALQLRTDVVHAGNPDDDIVRTAAQLGLPVTFLEGDALTVLRSAVADPGVAIVVLGAAQRGRHDRPAGHVAETLLTQIDKPALVVGPRCHASKLEHLERLLVPLDGSSSSADAVQDVVALFGRRGLDIVALHVFTENTVPAFFDQPQHGYPEFAERFLTGHPLHPSTRLSLARGDPDLAVLAAIRAESADVVAVAWSQRLEPGRARVIRRLLVESPVPVLLLPVASRDTAGSQP